MLEEVKKKPDFDENRKWNFQREREINLVNEITRESNYAANRISAALHVNLGAYNLIYNTYF